MQNEIEIMRVLRVPPKGQLVVEVKGNRYDTISELKNPTNQQLLLTAVGELITFAGGYKALVDAGVAAPIMAQPQKSIEEQRAEFLASLENSAKTATAKSIPSPNLQANDSNLSIVEQIDAILQQHIAQSPDLNTRSIHLIGAPNGGIKIDVDGKIYDRPKEIGDQHIQLIIKQALKEWESR